MATMVVSVFAAQTGNLTINGTTTGQKYALYKVLNLTQSGDNYSYTVTDDFKDFSADITLGGTTMTVKGESLGENLKNASMNSDSLSTLARKLAEYADASNITAAKTITGAGSESNEDESVTVTTVSGLDYGYYLLVPFGTSGPQDDYATMFSLNTLSGNDTEIYVKGVYPTVDKTVGNNSAKSNTASIGDEVEFTLTSKVPDMTGYDKYFFIVNDTLSRGLDFRSISEVKIDNTTLTQDTSENHDTADTGYYLVKTDNADGTEALKIVFKNFIQYKTQTGAAISIKYKATLNENAAIGTENSNTATLTYSNDPTANYQGENEPAENEPVGESASSTTKTYTTSLKINKVDGSGDALTGAAFRITGDGVNQVITTGDVYEVSENGSYYKLVDGTYTLTDPNGDNIDQTTYDSTTTKYEKKTKTTLTGKGENSVNVEAFVNSAGQLTFSGLGAGTYTISEIVTPDGYNSIADFDVTITFDTTNGFSATATGNNTVSVNNNELSMNVVNQSGSTLPSTGGIGTTMFYILGAMLVICAGVLLITRTRMHHSK